MGTIVFLAALIAPARAQPRCPGSAPPSFSGHPFAPVSCPGEDLPPPAPDSAAPAPPKIKQSVFTPRLLEGRWKGVVLFAGRRYLVSAGAAPAPGRFLFDWAIEDYVLHFRHKLQAELSAKRPGVYQGGVWHELLPKEKLKAEWTVWPAEPPFAWQSLLLYKGRPGGHRVRWRPEGKDALSFEYSDLLRPALGVSGTLVREKP